MAFNKRVIRKKSGAERCDVRPLYQKPAPTQCEAEGFTRPSTPSAFHLTTCAVVSHGTMTTATAAIDTATAAADQPPFRWKTNHRASAQIDTPTTTQQTAIHRGGRIAPLFSSKYMGLARRAAHDQTAANTATRTAIKSGRTLSRSVLSTWTLGTPIQQHSYSGMLSCFFHGFSSFLFFSVFSARAMRRRVECGMITSSI